MLSFRLQALVDLYPSSAPTFADIGSDHAYLPLALFREKKAERGFCVENKLGPYQRSKKAIEGSIYSSCCTLYFGDGLKPLQEKVDVLILAGMGGKLIRSILEKEKEKLLQIPYLLLDIHGEEAALFPFLGEMCFFPKEEKALYERGIYYHPLLLEKGSSPYQYSEEDILFNPLNRFQKEEAWKLMMKKKISSLTHLLEGDLPSLIKEKYQNEKEKWEAAIDENESFVTKTR